MKNYRLSFYGLSGFDYTGFDTEKEALTFAEGQTKLGIMTPVKLMKYDAGKDEYQVIADLSEMAKLRPSLDKQISDAEKKKIALGPTGPDDKENFKLLPNHQPGAERG